MEIPHHFKCPITHEIMQDPVMCVDEQTYEREAIEEWFKNHQTSPVTGADLSSKKLVQNIALRESIQEFLRSVAITVNSDNASEQEPRLIRGRGNTFREKVAPWIAFVSTYSGDVSLSVFLAVASTACMVFGVYALTQARKAANAPNYPIEVGIRFNYYDDDYVYTAITRCDNLARTNQLAVDFAIRAKIPANQTNSTYLLMMSALQFACGLITNVTLNEYVFTPTNGNVCNDVPSSSSTGCYSQNDVCYDYAHTNSGALGAMFKMLAQITNTPLLGLNCQGPKNATSEEHWIAVFVLMVIATLGCVIAFMINGQKILEKKDAFFRLFAQTRAETHGEEMTVLPNAVA